MLAEKNSDTSQHVDHTDFRQDGFDYYRLANRGGVIAIISSLMILNGSHALYVHTKLENGEPTFFVRALDIIALIGLLSGFGAFVVSLFLPTGRKRRQDTAKQVP